MSFAENLVYLRQHYGVTQEGLAEQLGVSRQTVSKWEAGTNYPEMDKLLTLCDLFHVSMDDLMRGAVSIAREGDTERYDRHMNRYDASIVAGVACILFGLGAQALADAFGAPGNLQAAALLAFVVVSVTCFVIAGLGHAEFKRRNPAIEPRYGEQALEGFGRRFPVMVAAGTGLALIDVIFLLALSPDEGLIGTIASVDMDDLIMVPFMAVMAVAVGLLIWAGMQKSKYDLSELTYIARRSDLGADLPPNAVVKTPDQVRAERIMGALCGIIMLLALVVFLVWGLVPLIDQADGWHNLDKFAVKDAIRSGQGGFAVSWIAFVVGGILCGIVCTVGSVVLKSNDDWIAEARQEDAWLKYAQSDAATSDPWKRDPEKDEPVSDFKPAPNTESSPRSGYAPSSKASPSPEPTPRPEERSWK